MNDLVSYLFETHAMKVCPKEQPFWYTSGKIGPYFINTHFLYGNEQDAVSLLSFIDQAKEDKLTMPKGIFDKVKVQYETNSIYHNVMDSLVSYIQSHIDVSEIDYISGGERRDWFFSYLVAFLLQKPHISIFKDLTAVESDFSFSTTSLPSNLKGKKVLHVADLITAASSYVRAWIPVIQNLGGELVWSAVIVDRMQGGSKRLEDLGIHSFSLVNIDESLFSTALEKGILDSAQYDLLLQFYHDPDGSMREFLLSHPTFLENALHADEKTASRAKLCVDGNLYDL